jgi:hypothetical protein
MRISSDSTMKVSCNDRTIGMHRQLRRIWHKLPDIIINACLKPPKDLRNVSGWTLCSPDQHFPFLLRPLSFTNSSLSLVDFVIFPGCIIRPLPSSLKKVWELGSLPLPLSLSSWPLSPHHPRKLYPRPLSPWLMECSSRMQDGKSPSHDDSSFFSAVQ